VGKFLTFAFTKITQNYQNWCFSKIPKEARTC